MKIAIFLTAVFAVFSAVTPAQKIPVLDELKEVTQLPAEVPQRVGAIAFDGEKLWVVIYLDQGRYVTYDPITDKWNLEQNRELRQAILKTAGNWSSPGGMVFVDGKMWVSSSYGDSFGWIDMNDPSQLIKFKKRYNPDLTRTQCYCDLAYDGTYIWAAWYWFNYKADRSKTHLLLKIDKHTGEVVSDYPIPFGNEADMALGLTWDGTRLWHAYGNRLRALDENGVEMAQYVLPGVRRASGMAWDGDSLWIVEFEGKLWKLPLR